MHRYLLRDSAGNSRPPRIALLVDRFDGRGGAEIYTRDLAVWLAARGCEVHVMGRVCGPRERRMPVTFHRLPSTSDWLEFVREVRDVIASVGADVTHDMGVAMGCDVFHSHVGSPVACQRAADLAYPAWYRPLRRLMQSAGRRRRIAAQAAMQFGAVESLCIALSHRGASDLVALHGVTPDRIRLVPNGVDAGRFSPASHRHAGAALRRRCGFAPDDVVVIGVAHNRRLKGMAQLARAVVRLRRQGLPLKLLLCGGRTASPAATDGAIVELGCVSDLAACYAAADIAVQPSFYDACSLATLESLASGLPVVTTRANGASELLTPDADAVVLDDAANVPALADALCRLACDSWLRASLGRAARRRALGLGVDAAFASIVAVYDEVTAARGWRFVAAEMADVRHRTAPRR